jgi:hypothetical protein
VEDQIFDYLVIAAFVLLIGVSIGIGYLTLVEWRDRRRRDQEARDTKTSRQSFGKKADSDQKRKSDKKTKASAADRK